MERKIRIERKIIIRGKILILISNQKRKKVPIKKIKKIKKLKKLKKYNFYLEKIKIFIIDNKMSTYEKSIILPFHDLSFYHSISDKIGSGAYGNIYARGDKYIDKRMILFEDELEQSALTEISILSR